MLKIDENSLQNSIIKDGQIVIGQVGNDSCIYSSATSSIVHGYANNNSKIYTNEDTFGSYAGGCTVNGSINADGNGAHAEGYAFTGSINAIGNGAHAEGYAYFGSINANGNGAHAEGANNLAYSMGAHAEGKNTYASNDGAHAEGHGYNSIAPIKASGIGAHAEGYIKGNNGIIDASGNGAHAEGCVWNGVALIASGEAAHAEGSATEAWGVAAHAEGGSTRANHDYSHAGGKATKTDASCQTVIGRFNANTNGKGLFVVGNGTNFDDSARSNAFVVYENGSYRANNMVTLDLSGNSNEYILQDSLVQEHALSLIRKYAQKFLISKVNTDNSQLNKHGLFFSSDAFQAGDEIIIIHAPTNSIDTSLLIHCYDSIGSRTSPESIDAPINLWKNTAVKILFTNETKQIQIPRGSIRKFVYQIYTGKFNN